MMRRWKWIVLALVLVVVAAGSATCGIGFTARRDAFPLETRFMRAARHWGTPPDIRRRANPVAASPETRREGMEHWADHCATCHANDGSGRTSIGRSLFPPAPDMRLAPTQRLTDGELFYLIERGIPLTGMPAWGNGTDKGEGQSWALVHFIRHLPKLTEAEVAEMEKLNPKSHGQMDMDHKMDDFLKGKGGD